MWIQTDKKLIFVNYIAIAKSSHIGFNVFYFFINQTLKKIIIENLVQYNYDAVM